MAKSESRLLSGRIKTKSGNTLDSRRTTFLSLDNAEPNFGNPDSDRYVLASLANGERLFLKLNKGFLVSADSVSGDESTFEIDPSGLVNANGTTLAEVLDQFDSAISLALLSGSITDDNFNGSGTVSDPLSLDSDLRIFGITGDSATFTNITSGNVNVNGTITTDELILGDNEKIQLGAGNDLQIYHDGSNSFITENGTGNLRLSANDLLLRSNDTYIQSEDGLNNAARFNSTTGVSLFRAGDLKLATTSTGVDVTGTITADGLNLGDNDKAQFGTGNDLQIYHSGTHSFITDVGTGDLKILGANIEIGALDNTLNFKAISGGQTTLYYAGAEKLATTSTGVDVTGELLVNSKRAIVEDDLIQAFNPFGTSGEVPLKLFASHLTDRFGGRASELYVTKDGVEISDTNKNYIFDGSFDTSWPAASAGDSDFVLNVNTVTNGLTNSNGFTYANGTLKLAFYPGRGPDATPTARWKDRNNVYRTLTVTEDYRHGSDYIGYEISGLSGNYFTDIEITISPRSDNVCWVAALEYHGDRMGLKEGPLLTTLGGTFYNVINAKFEGSETIKLNPSDGSVNFASNAFNVTGSGNVGIGTTSPATALDVSGTITTNEVLTDSATLTNITSSGTVDFSGATVSDGGTVTTVDIDGGTIDGATIATSDITVGSGKTLDVSAGTLTLANDQISGDKVEGGTIDTVTVNNLTSGNVNVDGGFIDGTAIGHITPDSGTFTNLARTSPSGVTAATYGSVTEIPVFTVDSSGFIDSIGEVSISTTLNTSGETGTGSVSLLDSSLNIAAGEGINTVASGNTITVSGELADNSNKGIASFDTNDFSVSSGAVSIKTAGVGNSQLENDTVTIGSTGIALGETSTTLSGLTQVNTTNLSVTDSATINHATVTTLNVTDSATINHATVTNLSVTDSATINHATITTLNVGGGNFTVQEASGNTQVVGTLDVEAQTTLASVNVEDLTDNRIVIVGASGELEDDPNFTFNGTQFDIGGGNFTVQQSSGNTQIVGTLDVDQQTTLASVNVQDLTNDRLVVAGTSGELEDDANLTYNGSTLTVANNTASTNSANGALVVTGGVGIGGALNVNGNTEIAGDLTVTGTTTTIEVQTLAINDPLIHLADSNESGDEVDIGFVGHYYDVALGGRQHTGLFRDATDDKYYLFAQYQDSALDSSPRANVIDRSDPSFVLADFNAATIFADTFSGTVSADSITTTNLTATGTVNFAGATVSDGGTVTTVDINGGTIDGATIATSNITVGSGKTLDVSAGTLTLANDQISGDKVEGGTINGVTINNLTSGNVNINSGFIDGTAIGHTTPDSGTFTNLTSDNLTVDTNTLYVDAVNNRVGIGTTSPNFKLDVMGSSRIAGDIHMFGQVRNYSGNFTLRNAASDADMFFNVNDGGVDTTVMTIDGATANVGIGTTTPAYDLDVDGSIGLTADATNKYYITNDGSFKIALAGIGSLVTVNSSGNVGIGTNSPSSLLDIEASTVSAEISLNHTGSGGRDYRIGSTGTGYGSAGNLVVYDATAGSERMRIDASGKVGIGTSSPADLLHVKSSTVAVGDYQIVAEGTTGGYGAGISFQSQLTGGSLAEMARITADGEAPWNTTANTQDAGLRFYTSLDGSLAERMRIDRSGNVGIGTTSPSSKLEVVAASSLDTALGVTIRNTNSTSDPQFELGVGYPGYYDNSAIIKHNNILTSYINTSGQMNFMTTVQIAANKSIQSLSSGNAQINLYDINNNTAIGYANNLVFNSSGTEIARFTNTGNLGIGTTSPATALDVAGTVTADGLTVDGDITFSDSDDLIMPDNSVIKLGDASDLQIYHDGSNSYVKDIGTGVLNVQGSSQVNIGGADGTIGVQFVEGANVTLRHNNVPILSTASTGINVTGIITADGIDLGDNEKAQFGASNDLQIYHDGFNSYIHDNGTGNLNLRATDHRIEDGSGNAYLIGTVGTVYLYKDGVQKLSTTSTGIDVTGEVTADSGTFTNLARTSPAGVTAGSYGSVTEIPVVTVDASGFIDSIGEVAISTTLNTAAETGTGSVNLLDSSLEIAAGEGINTTASGRTITVAGEDASTSNKGVASFDAGDFSVSSGAVSIKTAGVGNDQLEFDSVTVTAGSGLTGGGSIALGNSTELKLDSAAVKGLFSGGANINYNNSTGEISASASGVVAGVYGAYNRMPIITVDSYGQVDSIGLTAIEVGLADTVDSINFDSNTGVFRLTTDITQHFTVITLDPYTTDDLSEGVSNQYYTKTKVDSDIDQAFNENPSFGGTGAPFSVTSNTLVTNLNADLLDGRTATEFLFSAEQDYKTAGDLIFFDNVSASFGQSEDLRIYHDQQNSYINETGTGNLKLLTNGQSIILEDSTNDKVSGQFTPSASVELYYAGNKKFETSATGVTITGEVVSDSATINGPLTVSGNTSIGPTSAFTTGGTARLTVAGGNLAIGSSNSDLMYIRRQGNGEFAFQTYYGGNNGNIQLNPYGGYVGIGTTSPETPLTVASNSVSSAASGFRLKSNSGTYSLVDIAEKSTDGARLHMYDAGVEKIAFYTDGTANHISAGNVGIGTTAPSSKLDVSGSINATGTSTFGTGLANGLSLGGSSTTNAALFGTSTNQDVNVAGNGTGNVKFLTGASSSGLGSATERMRITNNGNVGIGTNSPANKLHVVGGNTRLDSNLFVIQSGQTYTDPSSGLTGIGIRNTGTSPNYNAFGIVTGAGAAFQVRNNGDIIVLNDATIGNDLTVTGNLTVSGTTTTVNTETINLADNIIVLNSNEAGTPSQNAGIEIERGTSTNVVLQWNETGDYWEIASGGTTGRILTTGDEGTGNGLDADTVDGVEAAAITQSGDTVTLTGDVTGSTTVAADGAISIATTIVANSVELGTGTTGNYVATVSGTTNEIEVTGSGSEGAGITIGLPDDVTVSNNLTVNNDIVQENHRFASSTITRASTAQVDLDTFSATTYSGAEVNIMAISSGERHITKLLVVHDGTTAYATEYGSVYTNTPLATYDVDISGGNVRIRVTPASATSTVFNTLVTLIEN